MAPTSVLATLHSITSVKQEELVKQRDECNGLKKELLAATEQQLDPASRVKVLVERSDAWRQLAEQRDVSESSQLRGTPSIPENRSRGYGRGRGLRRRMVLNHRGSPVSKLATHHDELFKLAGINPANLERYLEQSKNDTSISPSLMKVWETKLKRALELQGVKFEYAALFSKLVTERSGDSAVPPTTPASDVDMDLDAEPTPDIVGRPEMHAQRKVWEAYALEPRNIDVSRITNSLNEVFDTKENKQALQGFRDGVKMFGMSLLTPKQFDNEVMKWVIKGLIQTDLLSDDQTSTLKEIRQNETYLSEMADVLNMKVASLASWSWGKGGVPLEMRRQLNGKYRAYMHEDISQALLLHYFGIKWAAQWKERTQAMSEWTKQSSVPKMDRKRREYFFEKYEAASSGIESAKSAIYEEDYFMAHLPDDEESGTKGYGEDDLADEADQNKSNPLAIKQGLMHLLYTDAMVSDRISGDVVVLQTDFKWFGPSLSHAAIFATLEFFGMDKTWLTFFKKFLEAPLRFIHDGPNGQVRIRQRGVPMSHALSDMFGEAVFFHLDHAVFNATGGENLYRLHDDIWFWSDEDACIDAWECLNKFAGDVGLELNLDKTGASRVSFDTTKAVQPVSSKLPQNAIKWGFLTLDSSSGRLCVDQAMINIHIVEFRRQLDATTSVFAWIQAYNSYIQFIINNLCTPANCFGRAHIDMCLSTLAQVHRGLFPAHNGNIVEALKTMLAKRFPDAPLNIPDGFIYWPMLLGGLEVRNPFISLQGMRYSVFEDPRKRIDFAFEDDDENYRLAKEAFDNVGTRANWSYTLGSAPKKFMPHDEFIRYRYECSKPFLSAWEDLRQPAEEECLEVTPTISTLLGQLPHSTDAGIKNSWVSMKPYWQAVASLYGEEMAERFGGLQVVEKGLLPMGMVGLWKGGKVRWEG
ncbi:MAG: hypothetical protein MMC33_010572 [Icmadophila ericetorum]|nr:hypothetical protein [Icmadophila ericetorum]